MDQPPSIQVNQDGGWSLRWPNKPAAVVVVDKPDPRFWQFKGLWGECWLGPILAPWGSSPYLDWYSEMFYVNLTARSQ